ncbi:MAG: carbamoyltransferase C-terminal domain-containing protein [bacterium]|nr:carbamoyltransferase C-terminal domain-containing protein [bacterium]
MNVLGLKIRGHVTGACVISDSDSGVKVVAISEERLSREKHAVEAFPKLAIDYCLDALSLAPEDIGLIILEQVSARWRVPIKDIFLEKSPRKFPKARIEIVNHQDAHAASAFFCSPFEEAAVLVCDGAGEVYRTHLGMAAIETETLYRGAGNKLHQIQKTLHLRDGKSCPYTQGIGKLYSDITAYLNLGKYNEGKTMGLAPYGDDSFLKIMPPQMWFTEKEGTVLCNSRTVYPKRSVIERASAVSRTFGQKLFVAYSLVRMKVRRIFRHLIFRVLKIYSNEMFSEPNIFPPLKFLRPPRGKESLPDKYYSSVAYAAQKVLEMVVGRLALKLKNITGSQNLCVAGGVGLNIDANTKFYTDVGFQKVFIQPASSDAGIPLGAALYGLHNILERPRRWTMTSASLGRIYGDAEIEAAIKKYKDKIEVEKREDIAIEAARRIANGEIVGWFYGGSEYGPRALGNRSILCDGRQKDMKDIVNNRVKHREPWRPFAASVLLENVSEWFDIPDESPFMLLAAPVREEKRSLIPSVVHIDGTCRIQTVTKAYNGRYYDLIAALRAETGTPLLLDTSFNLAGEPIVETPEDAIDTFLRTEMDVLVLEKYLVKKARKP